MAPATAVVTLGAPASGSADLRPLIMSAHGDPQQFVAAQDVVESRLLLQDREAPNAFGQCGEQSLHLQAGEIHANARVRAGTETQMITRPPTYIGES